MSETVESFIVVGVSSFILHLFFKYLRYKEKKEKDRILKDMKEYHNRLLE